MIMRSKTQKKTDGFSIAMMRKAHCLFPISQYKSGNHLLMKALNSLGILHFVLSVKVHLCIKCMSYQQISEKSVWGTDAENSEGSIANDTFQNVEKELRH